MYPLKDQDFPRSTTVPKLSTARSTPGDFQIPPTTGPPPKESKPPTLPTSGKTHRIIPLTRPPYHPNSAGALSMEPTTSPAQVRKNGKKYLKPRK